MPEFILPGVNQLVSTDDDGVLQIIDLPKTTSDPKLIRFLKKHGAVEKPRPPVSYYRKKGGE